MKQHNIFYAHSWPKLGKKTLKSKEKTTPDKAPDKADEELNNALEHFFQEQLLDDNLRIISAQNNPCPGPFKMKEKKLIASSIGIIAVFAKEAEGIKRELRYAKKIGLPRMLLLDKDKVSIEFVKEFLSEDIIQFERQKFYLILRPLFNYLKNFAAEARQRKSIHSVK